jgi:vacuolar iron transporter family protein
MRHAQTRLEESSSVGQIRSACTGCGEWGYIPRPLTLTSPRSLSMYHQESHRTDRIGWLRAALLGANDGLTSTSSLVVGIASAEAARGPILLAAVAGLAAGAFSMAAGEFVSVSSQSDSERADLDRERQELAIAPETELAELTAIYTSRGLSRELAERVAAQLTAHDALAAHARDELGLSEITRARPIQAALASALAFSAGAAVPAILVRFTPRSQLTPAVIVSTLLILLFLGALAARLGGAKIARGALRVAFWGAAAMACTGLIGRLFGAAM